MRLTTRAIQASRPLVLERVQPREDDETNSQDDMSTVMHNHIYKIALSLCLGLTSLACDAEEGDDMGTATLGAEETSSGPETTDGESQGEAVAELTLDGESFVFDSGPQYRIIEEDGDRTYSLIVNTQSGDRTLIVTLQTMGALTPSSLQSELDVRITIPPDGVNAALAYSSFTDNPNTSETTTLTITGTDGDRYTGTIDGTLVAEQGSVELDDRERLTISGSINTPAPL